jgi:hypothetical protein
MDATGAGTAVMLGIAALLWFLYLVPTWLRRREYLATERTATRLQQTMRVMAETAELPDTVRVGLTAREAVRQERLLRAEQRRADAVVARQVAAARSATPAPTADPSAVRRARMRRTRALASLLMVAATVAGAVQLWLVATTGFTLGAFFVLVGAVVGGGVAISVQRRLDARATPRAAAPRARTAVQVTDAVSRPTTRVASTWTPVETPKPLYLSRPSPALAPRPDLQEALRHAVAESEAQLRAAQAAPEVAPMPAPAPSRFAPPAAAPSRFATMGQLDPSLTQTTDLDEVLRRRRAAG